VLLHLLDVIPAHGGFIHPIGLHSKFPSEAGGVILLGGVLLDLFDVVPSHGRLVLAILLHSELSPKTIAVVLLRGVLSHLALVVMTHSRLVHAVLLNAKLAAVSVSCVLILQQLLLLVQIGLLRLLAQLVHAKRIKKGNNEPDTQCFENFG